MATENSVIRRLQQPEYTGKNRCTPCTMVNVAIAVVLSAGLTLLAGPLGVLSLGLFLTVIYFRGYLVPGTPALTKRYFPDRMLRWFDKEPIANGAVADAPMVGQADEIDPEPLLRSIGALEPCRDGDDLCLTDEFAGEWRERIAVVREGDYVEYLATLLDRDSDSLAVLGAKDEDGAAGWTVTADGTPVARWESEAALVADVSAAELLRRRYPEWDDTELTTQGQLLHALRVFLDRCPVCESPVAFSERTVESCCQTAEVVALGCEECNARLLEVQV